MSRYMRRLRITLLALWLATGTLAAAPAPTTAAAVTAGRGSSVPATTVVATPGPVTVTQFPISNLNAWYTIDRSGIEQARIFSSPVGDLSITPPSMQWRLRNLDLLPQGSMVGTPPTAGLPGQAQVQIATNEPQAQLVVNDYTNGNEEDGVSLGLSVASINGKPVPQRAGHVLQDAVVFKPANQQLPTVLMHPTVAGMILQVTIPTRDTSGTVALDLRADLAYVLQGEGSPISVRIVQDAGGAITVQELTQRCADAGCFPTTVPAFTLESPVVLDSAHDALAAIQQGPAHMRLTKQGGTYHLLVSLDAGWLASRARVYPVRISLPIIGSTDTGVQGVNGTLQSCAPALPAQNTRIVAGSTGPFTDRGFLYFPDQQVAQASLAATLSITTSAVKGFPDQQVAQASLAGWDRVVSATLHLYTPLSSGPTGVLVYQNQPGALPFPPGPAATTTGPLTPTFPPPAPSVSPQLFQLPAIQTGLIPSWNSAPPVLAGAPGIAQSSSAGHWQVWDVTRVVTEWTHPGPTGLFAITGLTLKRPGAGPPQIFAQPLDVEGDGPTTAPYLAITLAPVSAHPGPCPPRRQAPSLLPRRLRQDRGLSINFPSGKVD